MHVWLRGGRGTDEERIGAIAGEIYTAEPKREAANKGRGSDRTAGVVLSLG